MTLLSITYGAESPNTLIRSARWNQNVSDVTTWANGNNIDETYNIKGLSITNLSISASAAIAASKLNLSTIAQVVSMSSSILKTSQGANVVSAATVTLGDDGNFFMITGTTTITSITAKQAGTLVTLQFTGILTLTNGSNLKLLANYVTAANDLILLVSDGTNWWEVSRLKANGAGFSNLANIPSGAGVIPAANLPVTNWVPNNIQVFTTTGTWTKPANVSSVYVKVIGAGGNGGIGSSNNSGSNGAGGTGGVGSNGTINLHGQNGGPGTANNSPVGGSSIMGGGALAVVSAVGNNGLAYGGGASGGTGTTQSGGSGGGGGYAEGIIAVIGNVTVTIGATNSFAGSTTIQATAGGNGVNGGNGAGNAGGTGDVGAVIVYY